MPNIFDTNANTIEALNNSLQAAAIVIAGAWTYMNFVHGRTNYPKLKGGFQITEIPVSPESSCIRVSLLIDNIGNSLLRIRDLTLRIQQISPPPVVNGQVFEPKIKLGEVEIAWPMIEEYTKARSDESREIEPGESDTLNFDFIIPNWIETIYVYAYIKNDRKRIRINSLTGSRVLFERRDIGWEFTTTYKLKCHDTRSESELSSRTEDDSAQSSSSTD